MEAQAASVSWARGASVGDAYRQVDLNALVRGMLDESVTERAKIAPAGEPTFFMARTGQALSSRSINLAVRSVDLG